MAASLVPPQAFTTAADCIAWLQKEHGLRVWIHGYITQCGHNGGTCKCWRDKLVKERDRVYDMRRTMLTWKMCSDGKCVTYWLWDDKWITYFARHGFDPEKIDEYYI